MTDIHILNGLPLDWKVDSRTNTRSSWYTGAGNASFHGRLLPDGSSPIFIMSVLLDEDWSKLTRRRLKNVTVINAIATAGCVASLSP